MDSVIINGEEPKLLQLIVWFQAKFQRNATISIQVGSRAPLVRKDYIPTSKVYFYSMASVSQLPVILIAFNTLKMPLDICEYQERSSHKIKGEDITLFFIYELMNSAAHLQQKYNSIKEIDDKISRGEGLSNFIRSQSQFLSLFDRDEDVQQIKSAEREEQRVEKDLSDQIISLRKSRIDFRVVFVLAILFFLAGHFLSMMEDAEELMKIQSPKKIKRDKKKVNGKKTKL